MIDIFKIKTFKANQMYFLMLLLGILQYMLIFHVNIFYMDFRQDKVTCTSGEKRGAGGYW